MSFLSVYLFSSAINHATCYFKDHKYTAKILITQTNQIHFFIDDSHNLFEFINIPYQRKEVHFVPIKITASAEKKNSLRYLTILIF